MLKMTEKQFVIAYKVARHLGHEWAWALPKDCKLRSPKEIAEATRAARWEHTMPGIEAPEVEKIMENPEYPKGTGVVRHETLTGRMEYEVWPCGHVNIEVMRPKGRAFGASITADGKLEVWERTEEDVPYATRHIRALEKILIVFGVANRKPLSVLRPAPLIEYKITPEFMAGDAFYVDIPRQSKNRVEALGLALLRREE